MRIFHWFHRTCKNHFVPHAGNDHHPHILRHERLLGIGFFVVFLKVAVLVMPALLPAGGIYSSAITSYNVISLTNAARVAAGLHELTVDSRLASAASMKAEDMLQKQYFAHTSPTGVGPRAWLRAAGYEYKKMGENLAVHYFESEDVQRGWMASPTHRANILDPDFTEVGVGIRQGEYEGYSTIFVVQEFGKPLQEEVLVQAAAGDEPVPEPEPEPTSEPAPAVIQPPEPPAEPVALTMPEVQEPTQPTVDQESIKLTPSIEGYDVELSIVSATSASVQVGNTFTPLSENEPGVWQGSIQVDEEAEGIEEVALVTSTGFNEEVIVPLAVIAPSQLPQDLFLVEEPSHSPVTKFLMSVSFDDLAENIYLGILAVLMLVMILMVAVKIEVQRHDVLVHTIGVLLLLSTLIVL